MKSFSEAADRNKQPILEVLKAVFADCSAVLEIGSGTGQHAVFFASNLPHLSWQPADLPANLPGIRAWFDETPAPNLMAPIALDIDDEPWQVPAVDAVFTANTIHIVSWPRVQRMFAKVGELLPRGGIFCTYGPYNVDGQFTSESNAQFEFWLKSRDPESGIRDIADLQTEAEAAGLILAENHAMPANNRTLVWHKTR